MFKTFLSFFKVGTIGFGGGSALIPVIEKQVVNDETGITPEDYLKHTVISNITPGALPVKIGATCGYQIKGAVGSLLGAVGISTTGVVLTIFIMALFSVLGSEFISYFNYAAVGISVFIVFLLIQYVMKTVRLGNKKINLLLCISAFILTGGREVRMLSRLVLGLDPTLLRAEIFDISTIDLMFITFFFIFLIERLRSPIEFIGVATVCVLYAFSASNYAKEIMFKGFSVDILIIMAAILILTFLFRRPKDKKHNKIKIHKSIFKTIALFMSIPIVLFIIIYILFPIGEDFFQFIGSVFFSTLTSFGGGEAFVTVADGFFVQSGLINPEQFYHQLIPIANALPGPILIKVVSGIGYIYGSEIKNITLGVLVALASGSLAIGCCGSVAVLLSSIYDNIKESNFIKNLQRYILPVICGMLISTSLSMIIESLKVTEGKNISNFFAFISMVFAILLMDFLHKRYRIQDIFMILGCAIISFALLTSI